MSKILVAGASGVIGRPLRSLLNSAGYVAYGTTRNDQTTGALQAVTQGQRGVYNSADAGPY